MNTLYHNYKHLSIIIINAVSDYKQTTYDINNIIHTYVL